MFLDGSFLHHILCDVISWNLCLFAQEIERGVGVMREDSQEVTSFLKDINGKVSPPDASGNITLTYSSNGYKYATLCNPLVMVYASY